MDSFVPFLHHSTTCKHSILYYSFVCQEYSQYLWQMLFTDKENFRCQYALTACTKCLDINNSTLCSVHCNYPHMPGRNSTDHWSEKTHPYIMPTHSLKCYITKFSPTPTIWRMTLRSKYIIGYGKPKHDKYIIYEFLHMATLWEAPKQESATTLAQWGQLYSHIAKGIQHITPFSPKESKGDTDSIWTLFSHTGMYVMAIGSLIPACLGIFCCYFFWCWPARLACWPLQPGTTQDTIVDDDIGADPIYRCDGKASQPARPSKNHGLHIEHIPTQMESQCKQQTQSLVSAAQGSLVNASKIQETQKCT